MLQKLIEQIKCEPKGTVNILIEDKLLNTPNSIVLFSVLGTLYLLGLINTDIYKYKSYKEIKFYKSLLPYNDFLSLAAFSLRYNLEYKG